MSDDDIWMLERQLWLDGVEVYEKSMDQACVMAFPGMGVMKAVDVLDSLKRAPRWTNVDMSHQLVGRAGSDVIALAYRAKGQRDDAPEYNCFCTSTYRKDGSRWLLVQHQQTLDQ